MNLTRRQFASLTAATAAATAFPSARAAAQAKPLFTPDLDSLSTYRCPTWFRDAKLGIWNCWGPESVPAMGDWYARNLYVPGHPQYEDHLKRYGHPSKSGYKDIIPLWKGENWDPNRLMGLYKKAGAKYFFAIAQHHDNFDCWNSKHHAWNSVKMGPHTDVIARSRDAARAHGLRFGVSEHLGASWNWWGVSHLSDPTGPLANVPYDGADDRYADLYHQNDTVDEWGRWYHDTPESFQKEWLNRITDLLDQAQPDLLYSDGSLPFGSYGRRMLSHFYNASAARNGGTVDAVYFCKDNPDGGQFRSDFCVQDLERGVSDVIKPLPWQTDTCIGDWYYKREITYKTWITVVQMLADIVSKNGNLLLNLPLQGDGTLDSREEAILAGLTAWMDTNGEAIHGTRPWRVSGEGHSGPKAALFNEDKLQYTAEDIRYTTKPGSLFAIVLAWPENSQVLLPSITSGQVNAVRMLASSDPLAFTQKPEGLAINLKGQQRQEGPFVLRIQGLT